MAKIKPHKFFKNKSQPEQKAEKSHRKLPSISRLFTERVVVISLFTVLFVIVCLAGLQAYQHFQEKEKVLAERKEVLTKIIYWQNVVVEHKGYRDGYFQLAMLWYQLGKNEQAKMYLGQALKLDPNFEEGRKLEKILQ